MKHVNPGYRILLSSSLFVALSIVFLLLPSLTIDLTETVN